MQDTFTFANRLLPLVLVGQERKVVQGVRKVTVCSCIDHNTIVFIIIQYIIFITINAKRGFHWHQDTVRSFSSCF